MSNLLFSLGAHTEHPHGVLEERAALGRLACIDRYHGCTSNGLVYQLTRNLILPLMG